MKSYGINKIHINQTEQDRHLESFYNLGYSVIENVLSEDELILLRSKLDEVYTIQENEIGKAELKKINEENLARMPLVYDDVFVQLAARPELLNYVEKILGNFYILHLQNGVINMPNEAHHQSSWHRDLPYQNWVSSEPLACNLYFCLDEFNEETGATFLLPFSHQYIQAPSAEFMEANAIQITAKPGSVVLFNSMLFHKAGYNRSTNKIRRGINHVYVKPIIAQQINLPLALNGRHQEDELLSMLLGYRSTPASSVLDYRIKKLSVQNKK